MSRPIITLTTDFGQGSPYVAEMKGVILTLNDQVNIVDVAHDVPPQDIRGGAHVLGDLGKWFPADTIHLAVVDPGVGTDRRIVYLRAGGQQYIAPDNGLLSLVLQRQPLEQAIEITNRQFWLFDVSDTFHGRDIMAPTAAHLTLGIDPEALGKPLERLHHIAWPEVQSQPQRIEGSIVSFDSFGNLITDITAEMLADAAARKSLLVQCGAHQVRGLVKTYAHQTPKSLIALIGSNRLLELAVVNGDAAGTLGLEVGERVVVTW